MAGSHPEEDLRGQRGGDSLGVEWVRELAGETFEDPGGIATVGAGRRWVVTHAPVGEAVGCRRHDEVAEWPGLRAIQGRPGHAGREEDGEKSRGEPEGAGHCRGGGSSRLGMKAKLLALIGADLVGKAMGNGDGWKVDEVDTLIATGIILMVIGALWLARPLVWRADVEKAEDHTSSWWSARWMSFMTNGAGPGWCSKRRRWGLSRSITGRRSGKRSRMEASSSTARRKCDTSWNQFQHDNKGKGLRPR